MTWIEILESQNGDKFVHLHIKGKGTVLSPISSDDLNHFEKTVDDPTPIQDRSERPFEVLQGNDGDLFVGVQWDEFSSLVDVHKPTDLDRLRQTIRSPQPFKAPSPTIN